MTYYVKVKPIKNKVELTFSKNSVGISNYSNGVRIEKVGMKPLFYFYGSAQIVGGIK